MSKSLKRVKEATMAQSIIYLKEKTYKGKPTRFAGGITLNVYTRNKL
jgi:hypothetical protein